MFILEQSPTFEACVRWESQAATGGKRAVHEFTGVFVRLTDDELRDLASAIEGQGLDDRAIAKRLLRGWGEDVTDASGNKLPYTDANVAAVLNVVGVASAICAAWRAAQPGAALGN